MKPLGIEMVLRGNAVCFGVTPSDRVADTVWEAVQAAIDAGWTPARFKKEMLQAWDYERDEQRKRELKELLP